MAISGLGAQGVYARNQPVSCSLQGHAETGDANVTEAYDGKRLLKNLLTLRTTTDTPLRDRILAIDHEITALDATIATRETALNAIIYRLYRLTPEEIATVEAG